MYTPAKPATLLFHGSLKQRGLPRHIGIYVLFSAAIDTAAEAAGAGGVMDSQQRVYIRLLAPAAGGFPGDTRVAQEPRESQLSARARL